MKYIELEKVRNSFDKIEVQNVPKSTKADIAMFRHCANGRLRVSTSDYTQYVRPVLVAHGYSPKLIDRSKRKP